MRISRQRKLIFVHNQKAAGTSIVAFLREHVTDLEILLPDHAYAEDGIAKLGRTEWDQHYSFGFVRNPWARLVSWHRMITERPGAGQTSPWWFYVRARGAAFDDFITHCVDEVKENCEGFIYRRSAMRNQIDYFTDRDGREAVTFIGRYERIAREFQKVQQALGLPLQGLSWKNAMAPRDYREFYNDRTQQIVARRFAKDIARFGYDFDNGCLETEAASS